MDHSAGLDVSVKETSICIVDETGRIVREVKVASEPEALLPVLKNPAYHFKRIGSWTLNLAFGHCLGCRHAPRLSGQTTFAAEFIRPHDCDDGFLPLLGKDNNFDLAVADVKDGIRGISGISLREDDLIPSIFGDGSPPLCLGEKSFGIEGVFVFPFMTGLLRLTSIHAGKRWLRS
jgi:hypothetical protein